MRTCGSGMASPPRLSGATGQFFEPQGHLVDPPVDKGQGTSTIKSSEVPSCPSDPNETTRIVPEDFWSTNGCPQWSAGTSRSTHRGPAHSGGANSVSRSGARPPLAHARATPSATWWITTRVRRSRCPHSGMQADSAASTSAIDTTRAIAGLSHTFGAAQKGSRRRCPFRAAWRH